MLAWYWYVHIQPFILKGLSILGFILSVLIIWSECTFQFSVSLSIPSFILAANTPNALSEVCHTNEILSITFISYMCCCTYWSLLRLKLLDFYRVIPNHNTDEVSMLFVGAYMCKLTFPVCYNYLNMGQVAGGVQRNNNVDYSKSSVFIQYIGPAVNMTPLFGEGYNDWMPWVLVIVCGVFLFNLHGRFLRFFNSSSYFYEPISDEHADSIEGKNIIAVGN